MTDRGSAPDHEQRLRALEDWKLKMEVYVKIAAWGGGISAAAIVTTALMLISHTGLHF